MYTDSISWKSLQAITLTEEGTSASSRIFVKILFQEIASNLGLKTLITRLSEKGAAEENLTPYL
jgi:pre-mRNA-splicing factor CWC22